MAGGAQAINLQDYQEFVVCHELGHALGMIHEQSRSDRDAYVTINYSNIQSGFAFAFDIIPGSLNQGTYDFDSVMHYNTHSFSSNGQATITINPPYNSQWNDNNVGQLNHLSDLDKAAMAAIYGEHIEIGQKLDTSIDQRFVDCYNRVGARVIGGVYNNSFVHVMPSNNGTGLAQDFIDANGGKDIIIAKDGAAQAYDVNGNIWTWYSAQNFASSPAGFPTGDLQQEPSFNGTTGFDTSGTTQTFEGGWVYDSKYGTHEIPQNIVSGLPLTSLVQIINGTLGFPTSDIQSAPTSPQGTSGTMINFEHGAVYNTAKYGIYAVFGDIYTKYAAAGSSGGSFGFPINAVYSWNGGTRQDFEGGYLTSGVTAQTHVLWTNPNGTASIWNYSTTDGTYTQNTYGPYSGWKATAIADGGTDGLTRVLWNKSDGTMSLWSLDNTTGAFTQHTFGPYPKWTAKALSVGPDNTTHVLWATASGAASIWNYSTTTGTFTQNTFGPYPNWVPVALADGADGKTRVLWGNYDGRASIWNLTNSTGVFSQNTFGPYPGWTANAISVTSDGKTHIMWDDNAGRMSLWDYDPATALFSQITHGPYSGWTAGGVTGGSATDMGVLWKNGSQASLWDYNTASGVFSQHTFGPYPGWSAIAISAGN